jgi:hypothetical protein
MSMTVRPSVGRARSRGQSAASPSLGRKGTSAALAATAVAAATLALPAAASATKTVPPGAPLPASNYEVRPLCVPPAPGYVSCFGLKVVPVTAAARAHTHPQGLIRRHAIRAGLAAEGAYGLRPKDLHGGYALPLEAPIPQTVALVDAYHDPTAESDLRTYDTEFGLPPCTRENGCFRQLNQEGGESPVPATNNEWAGEISLDIETAHAICQNCRIMLVEATVPSTENLATAERTAASLGATEISNSWGGPETAVAVDSESFNHPGVIISASAGDYGYLNWDAPFAEFIGHPDYPASSPHVVAVGGTRLNLEESIWKSETIWNDGSTVGKGFGAGGGGCSEHFTAQLWQQEVADWSEVGCGTKRAISDVSADADPYTGVAVYNTTSTEPGWAQIGGTSLASPIIAATFALAGGSGGVKYPAKTVYSHLGSSSLHDIVVGANGKCKKAFNSEKGISGCTVTEQAEQCSQKFICKAGFGYDGPSGVGTPNGLGAFKPPPPAVSEVAPAAGSMAGGTTVKVTGTNLLGASAVEFGGVAAEIKSDSASEVTVKSPAHAEGRVNVTVTTPGGTSATLAADEFTYFKPPAPAVTGVMPAEGGTAGGATVKILGTNLEGASAVEFGGSAAEIKSDSGTEITVKSPAHTAGKVNVTVTTPGGTSAISALDEFTYVVPPPTVSTVAPAEGAVAGGTTVKITGTNLEGASVVEFGGSAAEIKADSATEITVASPAHAEGNVHVRVTTSGGTSATSAADEFTYIPPPAVSNLAPAEGSTAGGTTVKITGTNLAHASAVAFGAGAAEIKADSATEITVKSPLHAEGKVNVTVTTPGGTSAIVPADEFTYTPPPAPAVTGVAPGEGNPGGGSTVTISGTNLEAASAVEFGGVPAEIKSDSGTEITVKSPAHAAGKVNVTVTTPGGTSATGAADEYAYVIPSPTVAKLAPVEGIATGGTTVTITGTNLQGASAVDFGGVPGTAVNVLSATELTVKTPAHPEGKVHVTVTTPGGTSATSAADEFTFYPVPVGPSILPETPLTSNPLGGGSGGGSGAGGGSNSNFNLLSNRVNAKTGAIQLTVAVFSRGTLHWVLSFRSAGSAARCKPHRTSTKGGCRSTTVVFGQGTQAVSGAQILTFTVAPGKAAKQALQQAKRRHSGLAVSARLSYTAAGASPVARTSSLRVRLKKAAKGHHRR